jgi:hypothetical protein
MVLPTDGDAVRTVRDLLARQGVSEAQPWRTTVVGHEQSGWVVRTWIQTPRHAARPAGVPDYVHRVVPQGEEQRALDVEQVHPPQPWTL